MKLVALLCVLIFLALGATASAARCPSGCQVCPAVILPSLRIEKTITVEDGVVERTVKATSTRPARRRFVRRRCRRR